MQIHFFLLLAENCPVNYADEESMILLDTGLESLDADSQIPYKELGFMTTLLIKSQESEPALSQFKAWWEENAGGELTLQLLATEAERLAPSRVEALDEMDLGGWSFNSSFVAFSAKSGEAQDEARQIICDCELQTH
jgi:hypothetical protein